MRLAYRHTHSGLRVTIFQPPRRPGHGEGVTLGMKQKQTRGEQQKPSRQLLDSGYSPLPDPSCIRAFGFQEPLINIL